VVNEANAKQEIEHRMSDVADLLALFVDVEIDPRAWQQLLIYAPARSEALEKAVAACMRDDR
jgi:hypothetical protein